VLNCRDVTERNELEQQLRHAQKLEAVGHLAGGLAHDFNNVLAVIRGYAEQLKADLPPTAEMRQQLDHLDQAVDRAAAVTKKLLAFGRHQSTKPIVIDLGRTLADLKPMLRHLLPSKTETVVESPPGLWHVKADPGQVEQVVLNLAFNGRDAMPDGGRLVIAAANRSVVGGEGTPAVPPGDYVALEVVDGGVGMSQEVQARIFEPFFTTKPRDQGSGLGLAMVYGIVTGAGGHIRVRSAPGQGTRFTIYWPSTREPLSQDSPRARQAVPSSAAASVLLVEDEAGVRSFTTRLLQRAGYSVTAVASGEEALFHFERYPQGVDLLVTDLVMPGMHGRELIDRVVTVRADLPVVCMTGFSGGDPDEPDLALKVAAVVDKPFRGEVLLDAVARALRPGPQDRATG
jgi:nitrogen-specific signal transduction histidine kinase